MKRTIIHVISLLLSAILVLCLAACGEGEKRDEPLTTKETSDHTSTAQETIFNVPVETIMDPGSVTQDSFYVFGKYEQDGNTENGPEPIEWIILHREDGKVLLVSRYALSTEQFNSVMWEGCTWEKSSLRNRLNTGFYGQSFEQAEKEMIAETEVLTDGKVTKDKVFLLSTEEVEKYMPAEEIRPVIYALYAHDQEKIDSGEAYVTWWLRSEYNNTRKAAVDHKGEIVPNYPFNGGNVRPAIWIYDEP